MQSRFFIPNIYQGGQSSGRRGASVAISILSAFFFLTPLTVLGEDDIATTTESGAMATEPKISARYEELKYNISAREDDIKKLEEEIADYKIRLTNVGNQKATLQNAMQSLDLTRAKLGKDITLTQKKIERANRTITELNLSIAEKELRVQKNKKLIGDIILKVDQYDSSSIFEVLLANHSLSEFFSDADDLLRVQTSIRDSVRSLERLKAELSSSIVEQKERKKELGVFNSRLADQKLLADQRRTEKNILLKETKNQESNYKKLLAEKEARKELFEREIDAYEAQLRAEIDPNSFPTSGSKVLTYPLDEVFITQKFGRGSDAKRLYVSGTHNGIDFRATRGTPIKASGDGIVAGTGDTDRVCRGASYGRWVLVNHKNGLSTLYAHLDLIKVREGSEVHIGDVLGYSGVTGYATGPHLHFAVLVTSALKIVDLPSKSCPKAVFRIPVAPMNAYLDPQAYL